LKSIIIQIGFIHFTFKLRKDSPLKSSYFCLIARKQNLPQFRISSNKPYFHYHALLLEEQNIWNNTTSTINNFPLGVLNFKLSATFMLSFSYNSPLSKRFSDSLKYSSFPLRWAFVSATCRRIISCYRQSHRRTVIEIHFTLH
jgi:hypothetical protein